MPDISFVEMACICGALGETGDAYRGRLVPNRKTRDGSVAEEGGRTPFFPMAAIGASVFGRHGQSDGTRRIP